MFNPLSLVKIKYYDWRAKLAIRFIEELDQLMIKAHWPRYKRRQAKTDLMKKHGDIKKAYGELKSKVER